LKLIGNQQSNIFRNKKNKKIVFLFGIKEKVFTFAPA